MNNSDRNAFYSALEASFELYGKAPSEQAAKLFFDSLERFDISDVLRALSAHVQNPDNGQYLPKPADIIKIIDGDSQTAALRAWSKVASTIRSVGSYSDVVFDDPMIHLVIADMGGWVKLNEIMEEELPFKSNEFVKRYSGGMTSFRDGSHPKVLTGIANAHNSVEGHSTAKPVLIGCQDKARQVYKLGSSEPQHKITRLTGDLVKKLTNDGGKQ